MQTDAPSSDRSGTECTTDAPSSLMCTNSNTNPVSPVLIDSQKDLFESDESDYFEEVDRMTEAYLFMPGERGDYNELSAANNCTHPEENLCKLTYEELLDENKKLKIQVSELEAENKNLRAEILILKT